VIKWSFPSNNSGEIKGFNDSGIATFSSKAYASLAREICQNSLDAAQTDKTVRLEFSKFFLPKTKLSDYKNFRSAVEACYNQTLYYKNDKKPRKFFRNCLDVLDSQNIIFLRISDFNTTGLTGSNKHYNTNWINLVKGSGSSDKGEQAGGSFGIGKSAPFVCSSLRTVFYSTLDIEGLKATQGIARFISFELENKNLTSGTGYYGEENKLQPIRDCISLQDTFKRTTPGTDIFIAGFIEDENWVSSIVLEILDNYFYAIFKGELEVIIESEIINSKTLPDIISKYRDTNKRLFNFYQLLISKETRWHTEDFDGKGIIKLGFLLNNDKDSTNSVAMIRKPWMKIYEYKISFPLIGVFIVEGDKLNSFLRTLENPAHDKWEAGRAGGYEDIRIAKNIVSRLHRFIREKARDFFASGEIEEEDLVGADEFFPIEDEIEDTNPEDLENDYLSPKLSNITKKLVNPKTRKSKSKDMGNYIELEKTEGLLAEGSDITINIPNGTGKRGKNFIEGDQKAGSTEGDGQTYKAKLVSLDNIRLICLDKNQKKYRLILKYHLNKDNCYLTINKLDEQGGRFPIKIMSASYKGKNLKVKNNKAESFKLVRGENTIIDLMLDENKYFGGEVLVYGFEE